MVTSLVRMSDIAVNNEGGGADPVLVGAGALFLLLVLLVAVISFGGGREHS